MICLMARVRVSVECLRDVLAWIHGADLRRTSFTQMK